MSEATSDGNMGVSAPIVRALQLSEGEIRFYKDEGYLVIPNLLNEDAIAAFLFGDAKLRRRVYNLVEKKALPVFRIGSSVCARKSVLLAFIAEQENSL